MNRTAIVPGSFDPCTNGHFDIICRSAKLFEKVIAAVLTNSGKSPAFTAEQRVDMLRRVTAGIPNVEVDSFYGLLADYAEKRGAGVIIKGLRAVSDFEYEFQMALTNKNLNGGLETVFMTPHAENMYLSSGIVREVARYGGCISGMVPQIIEKEITDYFVSGRKDR